MSENLQKGKNKVITPVAVVFVIALVATYWQQKAISFMKCSVLSRLDLSETRLEFIISMSGRGL